MKKLIGGIMVAVAVLGLSAWALAGPYGPTAHMGGYGWSGRMGPGMMMGGSGMGPGLMGAWGTGPDTTGPAEAPCWQAGAAGATATQVTEQKAKELATDYATKYLPGFTVDKVLPFTGMHHTMYQVELKGPQGELRTLHINPWGQVMPFGPYGPRAATQ